MKPKKVITKKLKKLIVNTKAIVKNTDKKSINKLLKKKVIVAKKPAVKKAVPAMAYRKIRTDYLSSIYSIDLYHKIIDDSYLVIKDLVKKGKIDSIAFTGTSGAAIAYPLSYKLKLPLICVRKTGEKSHYTGSTEGDAEAKKYLIVDDFIQSGKTINNIIKKIKRDQPNAKAVGIFLYTSYSSERAWEGIPIMYRRKR